MGSTWSGPVAYLQKQGWPRMGIPASFEILCSCWVKFLQRKNTYIEISLDYQFFTSYCRLVLYINDKIFKYSWHLMNNFHLNFKIELFSFTKWHMNKTIKHHLTWCGIARELNINFLSNQNMLCSLLYLRASSLTVLWGAKQAMAHTLISVPE